MPETVKKWLKSFPQWGNTRLWVDNTHYIPGSAGLFCEGLEEISRKQDILGTVKVINRCRFTLDWVMSTAMDPQVAADMLLSLQSWVQQQDLLGLAPALGKNTHWKAEAGKRREITDAMTVIYTVSLTAQYEE